MNSSKARSATNHEMVRFTAQPHLEKPSFLVGWMKDAGAVSRGVADFLAAASGGNSFGRIEPASFFNVGGVAVEDDVARFPQSRLFANEQRNVVMLRSDEPQTHRYEFLSTVLDLAEHCGRAQTLYTVNGIASMIPHRAPRRAILVFNDPAVGRRLRPLVSAEMNWEGPPHTSTYLLWLAGQRHLPAAGLWFEVPFYLSRHEDPWAIKEAVSLLGRILGWGCDLRDLDERIARQDGMLARLRQDDPQADAKIRALEQGEALSRREQSELVEAVQDALKGHN